LLYGTEKGQKNIKHTRSQIEQQELQQHNSPHSILNLSSSPGNVKQRQFQAQQQQAKIPSYH